jgi:hypothetical protein
MHKDHPLFPLRDHYQVESFDHVRKKYTGSIFSVYYRIYWLDCCICMTNFPLYCDFCHC